VSQWYALLAPAGTPRPVVARLSEEIRSTLEDPEVVARIAAEGSEAVFSTASQLAAHIRAERERWARVIRQSGIRG
jgi:tripartite-type tricarboxylate transporter receptor subunit TctC